MKIVQRLGVFETNSSSTHTLALVSKKDYKADKASEKPKYLRYGVVATKEDKLLMACGCCKEICDDQWCENEEDKAILARTKLGLFVDVYCKLTGDDYDKTYKMIDDINRSGRACHMKFFSEGALYDAEVDYMLIDDMLDGELDEVLAKIRRYFDDENVLLYREYYSGIGMYDDDDQ